jgi:hypothetical protein
LRAQWAEEAEAVVWMRSKLGLRMSSKESGALDRFVARRRETL